MGELGHSLNVGGSSAEGGNLPLMARLSASLY